METKDSNEKQFVALILPKDRRMFINASIDEIEATQLLVEKHSKKMDARTLRNARLWVEMHKRLLKLMGHKKKIVVKFPKLDRIAAKLEDANGKKTA